MYTIYEYVNAFYQISAVVNNGNIFCDLNWMGDPHLFYYNLRFVKKITILNFV